MSTFLRVGLVMVAVTLAGCIGEMSYKRVDEVPPGAQIDAVASSFYAVVRSPHVRYLYPAPYEDVWGAIKRVMETVKESGTEPHFTLDEENGLFAMTLDHRDDIAKTMDNPNPIRIKGWREEFRFELVRRPDSQTLVIASRVVLGVPFNRRCPEYVDPCPNPILFQPEVSNGQVERWILTRIREEVEKVILARFTSPAQPYATETSVATPSSEAAAAAAVAPALAAPEPSPSDPGGAVIQPRANRPAPTAPLSITDTAAPSSAPEAVPAPVQPATTTPSPGSTNTSPNPAAPAPSPEPPASPGNAAATPAPLPPSPAPEAAVPTP